ncbi:MAG: aldose 1-epimerase [Candidatus Limnocylindria bacterium]
MGHPTGLTLESEDLEVELLPEHGARLHRIRAFGVDLLRTPDDVATHGTEPFFWGAYLMAPWCNRVQPGPIEIGGRTIDLSPNFGDGSAIHGQVYALAWEVESNDSLRVTGEGDGWPWAYDVHLQHSLDARALTLSYALTNRSDAPMPAGIGLHPWFRRPVELRLPADAVYRSNSESAARPEPVSGDLDIRRRMEPALGLDATWTAMTSSVLELGWPRDGIRATLEVSSADPPLVAVATPRDVDADAVEPQTHGPDGLRRLRRGEPDAMQMLGPGASLDLVLRLTVDREAG